MSTGLVTLLQLAHSDLTANITEDY